MNMIIVLTGSALTYAGGFTVTSNYSLSITACMIGGLLLGWGVARAESGR